MSVDQVTEFCQWGAKTLPTYGSEMYEMFGRICQKVIDGDQKAKDVVQPFIEVYNKKSPIDYDEYKIACVKMENYIYEITGKSCTKSYYAPKKFYDEIVMFYDKVEEEEVVEVGMKELTNQLINSTAHILLGIKELIHKIDENGKEIRNVLINVDLRLKEIQNHIDYNTIRVMSINDRPTIPRKEYNELIQSDIEKLFK